MFQSLNLSSDSAAAVAAARDYGSRPGPQRLGGGVPDPDQAGHGHHQHQPMEQEGQVPLPLQRYYPHLEREQARHQGL